ncbi:hypothetical protein ACU81Q_11080 [Komagataeibacter melomenusus]
MSQAHYEQQKIAMDKVANLLVIAVPEDKEKFCLFISMEMKFIDNGEDDYNTTEFKFVYEKKNGEVVSFSPFWNFGPQNHSRYIDDMEALVTDLRDVFARHLKKTDQAAWNGMAMKVNLVKKAYDVNFHYPETTSNPA